MNSDPRFSTCAAELWIRGGYWVAWVECMYKQLRLCWPLAAFNFRNFLAESVEFCMFTNSHHVQLQRRWRLARCHMGASRDLDAQ